jgi:predicted amidohydrolase YtcJ
MAEISPAASGPFGSIVDLEGATLMPGVIDAHFHTYAVEVDFLRLESYPLTYLSRRCRPAVARCRGKIYRGSPRVLLRPGF